MSVVTKFLLTILIFMYLSETPLAEQRQQCVPSSCGHIHNISYSFRLKSDPKHCGLENYELSCEGDRAIITIRPHDRHGVQGSLNYYVQAINYDNSTIRLTDPGIRVQVICSLPQNSIPFYTALVGFASHIYIVPDYVELTVPITLFSCPFALNSPVFVEITNCLNRSYASNYYGLENYELSCEGYRAIVTIFRLIWYGSLNYYVQAINYDNSTIRLVDPGIREQVICSLPQNSITVGTSLFGFSPFTYKMSDFVHLTVPITLFSCPFAINSPVFVEITNCLNRSYASNVSSDLFKGHTYATMTELSPSDLKVGCSVDLMSMTSWRIQDANANISILSLHNPLAYGFEFSWFRDVHCGKCANPFQCEGENSSDVHCLDFSCKVYNFRFLQTQCAIIPWILSIAGKSHLSSFKYITRNHSNVEMMEKTLVVEFLI
ncbi:hypothetical protein H5410_000650 [Solanum commersonii]|uniref:Wall-associated receptor kinase galacturonan-binding domain-containing protein n=1 Tax=Solanum commersonii TaxID=4109 RepID=A0A9J6AWH0_SOLCO|nr:hypothetical protein H5410_000650 [Solanum commersonii]